MDMSPQSDPKGRFTTSVVFQGRTKTCVAASLNLHQTCCNLLTVRLPSCVLASDKSVLGRGDYCVPQSQTANALLLLESVGLMLGYQCPTQTK